MCNAQIFLYNCGILLFDFQNKKEPVYADLYHSDTHPSAPLAAAPLEAATQPVVYTDLKVHSPITHIAKMVILKPLIVGLLLSANFHQFLLKCITFTLVLYARECTCL